MASEQVAPARPEGWSELSGIWVGLIILLWPENADPAVFRPAASPPTLIRRHCSEVYLGPWSLCQRAALVAEDGFAVDVRESGEKWPPETSADGSEASGCPTR